MNKTLKKIKQSTYPLIISRGRKYQQKNLPDSPIIIGGCARSGTTLLTAVLGAHPSIYTFPKEMRVFNRWNSSAEAANPPAPRRIDKLYRYLLFNRIPRSKRRWAEKSATNVRYFPELLAYYGQHLKLINIVRDGRDVMTSYHPVKPNTFYVEPPRWIRDIKAGLEFDGHPQVFRIRYEDLALDFEATVRNLMEFLEGEFHPNLMEYHRHTPIKNARGWFDPVQEVFTSSIERWKKPAMQTRIAEIMQFDDMPILLRRLGYDVPADQSDTPTGGR